MIINDKGIALITAIMMLVILTIIGIAALNTTLIERDIANSEVKYKTGFYKADSGISAAMAIPRSHRTVPITQVIRSGPWRRIRLR